MNAPSAPFQSDEPGEDRLLARARDGDLDAFNELVDRHQRLVYNLCCRMLGSTSLAEDVTQDTFLSAFRNITRCKGDRFRPWLLRIAANACTDELRRRTRRRSVSLDAPQPIDEAPIDPPDPAPGPESEALRSEQRRQIAAALLRLPGDQRLAVVLCDIQGLSYDEISAAMGVSIGTVKSRIARGREKLRHEVSGLGTFALRASS